MVIHNFSQLGTIGRLGAHSQKVVPCRFLDFYVSHMVVYYWKTTFGDCSRTTNNRINNDNQTWRAFQNSYSDKYSREYYVQWHARKGSGAGTCDRCVNTGDTRGFSSDLTRCLCDGVDDELRNIRALATTPHTAFLQTGASNLTATRVDALTVGSSGVDAPLFHETRVAELSGSTKETERTETGNARVAVVIMSVCERVESRCVTCLLTHVYTHHSSDGYRWNGW